MRPYRRRPGHSNTPPKSEDPNLTVIPRSRRSRGPGDLSQPVDGEAQVPRMPALQAPWDDGGMGFEKKSANRRAPHPQSLAESAPYPVFQVKGAKGAAPRFHP